VYWGMANAATVSTEEEEAIFVHHLFAATTTITWCSSHSQQGRAYVGKVYEIPEMGGRQRRSIAKSFLNSAR